MYQITIKTDRIDPLVELIRKFGADNVGIKDLHPEQTNLTRTHSTWTREEKRFLHENWGKMSVSELAEKLQRSRKAIQLQIYKQHSRMRVHRGPRRKWTQEDNQKLASMIHEGKTQAQIALEMGRTPVAIRVRLQKTKHLVATT
jgi:hypothetical protein